MRSFFAGEQRRPPPARRATDVAIMRFEHIYEVEPSLMAKHVPQQELPNWDMLRIANGRHDHLAWMHRHWAGVVVSGAELLAEVGTSEDGSHA